MDNNEHNQVVQNQQNEQSISILERTIEKLTTENEKLENKYELLYNQHGELQDNYHQPKDATEITTYYTISKDHQISINILDPMHQPIMKETIDYY